MIAQMIKNSKSAKTRKWQNNKHEEKFNEKH